MSQLKGCSKYCHVNALKKKSDLLAEAGQDELDIASLKVIKVRKHYILSCRAKRLKMNFTKLIEFLFEV